MSVNYAETIFVNVSISLFKKKPKHIQMQKQFHSTYHVLFTHYNQNSSRKQNGLSSVQRSSVKVPEAALLSVGVSLQRSEDDACVLLFALSTVQTVILNVANH